MELSLSVADSTPEADFHGCPCHPGVFGGRTQKSEEVIAIFQKYVYLAIGHIDTY